MKQGLIKLISEIFKTLQITVPFEVYCCNVDALPEWTKHIQLTHEFLVCCEDISERDKLQTFIGKRVLEFENRIYWFEGERILVIKPIDIENVEDTNELKVNSLKTETQLPAWLDDLIFNKLHAEYAPDFQRFEKNLELTEEENLKYLGTYFPRSYSEAFCIFDNIFQNAIYRNAIFNVSQINILSVGCGTGGDLLGLLTVIEKYCHQPLVINIWAIDGNTEALSILKRIVDKFITLSSKTINLVIRKNVFSTISDIDDSNLNNQKFEFILSFKLICEIISYGEGTLDNSYYDFVHKFVPTLSTIGLCILLDVTTKPKHTKFNPILMNRQVNQALGELLDYKTLLPISCNLFGNECFDDCFYQKTFSVTHQKRASDKSKVAYRVIANRNFVNMIQNDRSDSKLLIHNDVCCPFTENEQHIEDAYQLKNKQIIDESISPAKSLNTETHSYEIVNNKSDLGGINDGEIFQSAIPKIGVKVVGFVDLSQFEKPKHEINVNRENYYIIDTNVFIEYPEIISKIGKSYHIILSAKVIDELDHLKTNLQGENRKNAQKALKLINDNLGIRDIVMDTADLNLLPGDFSKKSPDNFILSVALKYKTENPILLTSDNGLQVKAKGMKITTITLKEFLKQTR